MIDTIPTIPDILLRIPFALRDEVTLSLRAHLAITATHAPTDATTEQNAALITTLQTQLAAANVTIKELELVADIQHTDGLEAIAEIKRLTATNAQQSDLLKEANATIARLQGTPPVVVPPVIVGELPGFATYIVDTAGNGPKRTATMKGYIDKLKVAGIKEVVMLVNDVEIDEGDIPEYLAEKDVGLWADTFMAVYKVQSKKTAADAANPLVKIKRDYFAETVKRCDGFKAHRGYVLDDVHSISPAEFETVTAAIRQHSQKPIVASFGVLSDITLYLPTINRHKVYVARQLYRQEKADERLREDRTDIITDWLKKPGMVCHVGNLEYFNAGGEITSGDDLREMYNRCIAAGLKSFMGYAVVDSTGFKIWEHPDLWAAFKDCATAYPAKVKIP